MIRQLEHTFYEDRLKELELLSLEKLKHGEIRRSSLGLPILKGRKKINILQGYIVIEQREMFLK